MDALFPALTRRFDPSKPIGYLNFSDGRPDARFRKVLADACGFLLEQGEAAPHRVLGSWLKASAAELQAAGSAAFKDVSQALEVIRLGFEKIPAAYRKHHSDLLAHQPDQALFNPFFLARACEVAMGLRAKGTPPEKLAKRSVRVLNDFVGYRPIAVLETRPQTDYYPHEKVAAVPLYFRGVGAVPGQYAEVVRTALDLLDKTDRGLLDEACLEPERLEELAFDPRATDHFHPVNKRPNVLFGEWDPHHIDGSGYYRRFVLRQGTLDALVDWSRKDGAPDPERLLEASAVLAGTILMGSGISGSGPTHYDSTVTLAKLVQKIARFRDKFYQRLLESLPGGHGSRLRAEAAKLKQPFGGVRQSLNRAIAAERALHLQERRLAIFFSAMGYTNAARERASAIPAPATRMLAEIRLRQTAVQFAIRSGRIAEVPQLLGEVEELLKRGIDCGALIDPWNILGFQGLFPTFADRGDTVRDPRAEDLILSVGRQFDAYAAALGNDGAQADPALAKKLRKGMAELAHWWDKYATSTVAEMPRVVGAERAEAAEHVAKALSLWKTGGAADPSFWRKHLEGFRTPSAFAQVVEALLDRPEYKASMALLATWLSEVETVPLQDSSASFFRLAFRWLKNAAADAELQPTERGALVRRFMELLEANADEFWNVPEFGSTRRPRADDEDFDDEDEEEDDDTFASAYEEMTYKDSTDDGNDSALADDDPGGADDGQFPFEADAEEQLERLRFLNAVARMWRLAARPDLFPASQPDQLATIAGWVRQSRESFAQLMQLCQQIHAVKVPEPLGGLEGVSEFDRRRGVKGRLLDAAVQTTIETAAAARALTALLPKSQELPSNTQLGPTSDIPPWEGLAIRLEKAIGLGDARAVRQLLPRFVQAFRHEPLLVCPPGDGGGPVPAVKAQVAQQMMESLLARLPRLGLLRETYQLTRLARQMERNEIPEGRRVSSFDVLFRTAVTGTTEAILTAARDWDDSANEDGPLAASLRVISESYQKLWYEHSQTLRLSSLEAMIDGDDWKELKAFIRKYGSDLFTVRFMTLSNVRGILAQGAEAWLDNESGQADADGGSQLVLDWETGAVDKPRTARLFETVLNALVEHYDEYRDYNTTTTQSDYGENLYTLLDFLRLKVTYDRHAWRLKPLVLAHEVLCKRGYDRLAAKWREFVNARTSKLADDLLDALAEREAEHGIRLRTVRDRLEERFVQPLRVDQAGARVPRAAAAIRDGQPENNPAFQGLLAAIRPLAEIPVGVGLDVPHWVRRLEDELRNVKLLEPDEDDEPPASTHGVEEYPMPTFQTLSIEDLRRQLRDWDTPLEGS
jgi:hypothetical protein